MNKAEEQQFAILISELNSEREERRKIQKKFELLEKKNSALEAKNEQVQQERDEKVNEISVLVKQMAQYMMGNGPITLSEELKNSILAEFRAEQEEKDRKKDEAHAKEMQDLKDFFAVQIAAKDNELNALRAKYGESDNHGTTNPGQSISGGMSPEDRIKQLEQQKNKYAIDAYGQGTDPRGKFYYINLPAEYKNPMGRTEATESVIALVYMLHGEQRMTDSEIVTFLKSKGLNFSEGAVKNWIKKAADILAPLDEPTQEEILATGNDHVDESGIEVCDQRLPNKGEKEEDVEKDKHYFDRWMFCHHADSIKLTQFVFFERGRRTRKAVEAYLSKAKKRLFVNSDGCPIYKCYDVTVKDLEKCSEITDIIIRVSCLVHMRRPFFKLKDCSQDAIDIVHLADEVFRNHSFFVGSPQGGARLARTLTIFANCKAYNIDPYKYLCDVFRRIKTTAKDQLVNLVAHKWQPQMAPAIY